MTNRILVGDLLTRAFHGLLTAAFAGNGRFERGDGGIGPETGTIVTRNEDERIETGGGTIEIIPVWRYFLDQTQPVE